MKCRCGKTIGPYESPVLDEIMAAVREMAPEAEAFCSVDCKYKYRHEAEASVSVIETSASRKEP